MLANFSKNKKILTGRTNQTQSNFKNIKNSLYSNNPAINFNRQDQVKLSRLRIGHSNLSHIHLITKNPQQTCDFCSIPITVIHIFQYHKTTNERRKLNLPENASEILNCKELCKKFPEYLKLINAYNNI